MNAFLLGAVALAVAVPAMAQMQSQMQPQPPMAPMAPRMDGIQTRDQVVAKVRDHFARMDINRDGFVASDEMQSVRGQPQGTRRNGNRMVQGAGGGLDPSKAFDRIDANRDGMISRDEFAKGRETRIERKVVINRAPGAGVDGASGGMRKMRRMGAMGGGRMGGRMMKMADLNQDGRVSLQEATTIALQRFERVDSNRDGRITPDERRQHRDMRHNRKQSRQMRAPAG